MNVNNFPSQNRVIRRITLSKPKTGQVLIIFVFLLITVQNAFCATRFFEGGDWHKPESWTNSLTPAGDDDVIVLGSGSITKSVNVRNITVGPNSLTIDSGTVTVREIRIPLNGILTNNGTIELIKDVGLLLSSSVFRNNGTVTFVGGISASGYVNNSGTLTGSPNSLVSIGNNGTFDNFGTIDGTGVNFQINNGTFNNNAIINIDLSIPIDFNVTSTGQFSNVGSIICNSSLIVKDDAVFENRNIINTINTSTNRSCLQLSNNAIFRNYVNLQVDQLVSDEIGIVLNNASQFENYGLCVLKNAPLRANQTSSPGYFKNFNGAEVHISNTDNEGLFLNFGANSIVFLNEGKISVCQSNQLTGTCPISISQTSILTNLPDSELFTGVDIFNGNCSMAITNNISNQGQIFDSCATLPDINCPINYTGTNAITGAFINQQQFETDGAIEAIDAVLIQGPYSMDSGTSITLIENFEVNLNTVFEAFIDGCGGI